MSGFLNQLNKVNKLPNKISERFGKTSKGNTDKNNSDTPENFDNIKNFDDLNNLNKTDTGSHTNDHSNKNHAHTNKKSKSNLQPVNNQFTKILSVTKYLPTNARSKVLTKAFGRIVPFVGTAGVYYETVDPNQVIVSLNNDKTVQNHIGSIHAVAVTLLAETATGFILGLNLPADRVLLVKSYQVNFYRPLKKGQVAAIATLSDEQRQYILDTPTGDMVIPCVIDDRNSTNERDPITVEMTWAWIPKAELEARRKGKNNQNNNADNKTKAEDNPKKEEQKKDNPKDETADSQLNDKANVDEADDV